MQATLCKPVHTTSTQPYIEPSLTLCNPYTAIYRGKPAQNQPKTWNAVPHITNTSSQNTQANQNQRNPVDNNLNKNNTLVQNNIFSKSNQRSTTVLTKSTPLHIYIYVYIYIYIRLLLLFCTLSTVLYSFHYLLQLFYLTTTNCKWNPRLCKSN